MLVNDKFFNNQFEDPRITNLRLTNFAEDSLTRFTTLAIEGQFALTITAITAAVENLREDLGEVDSSLNDQKIKTFKVTNFLTSFKQTMRAVEGMIILRSGGQNSDLYKALYPKGITEYSKANKTKMPVLMLRMNDVATNYETALGTEIAERLGSLKTGWQSLRSTQTQQKTEVEDNRTSRTIARKTLEMTMTNALHTVALAFPGQPDKCNNFFNFRLLLGTKHHNENGEDEVEDQEQNTSEDPGVNTTPEPEQPVVQEMEQNTVA
jgi:hypothetical protein